VSSAAGRKQPSSSLSGGSSREQKVASEKRKHAESSGPDAAAAAAGPSKKPRLDRDDRDRGRKKDAVSSCPRCGRLVVTPRSTSVKKSRTIHEKLGRNTARA
jgi:hypothetical protein